MDSYFELCRRWCKPILLHLAFFFAFTQFSTAQDFDVTAQANENGALEVKWYTKHQNQRFRIILKNQETQKETRHIILNSGKFVLDKYDPLTDYQITVENLGNDDKVLRAGSEKFLGRVTLQNYAQQFAAKANPNTINANLQVVMRALNAQSFPFIYSTIDVSDGVAGVDNLSVANFKAYEDGARQTNHFNVTPAGTGGGTRILDMIFIIDDSGSMGDEQQAVINNVNNFVDQLVIRNINFRLGLVRFGQNANSGNPILMNNGNMTDDVELFKQILSTFQAAGGTEPGIQAVYDAATSFSFRPGSQRHFLLITDEDSDGGDLTATINVCNNNGIIVHSATLCTSGSSQTDYCDSNSIRGQTGGIQKSVIGPYDDILDAILKDVASSYIVSYRTINDVATSGLREVKINVDALGQNKNVIGYYGFGWPIITLTNRTINLSKTGQLQNTAVLIQVKVTDSSQPFVQSVLCYYRQTGTSSWSSLTMVHVGNNIYEATIPAYAVVEPGMDYYIRATDGQTTSTYPEQDPSIYPVQFAVLPNQPPAISHTPVLTTAQNTAVSI
ncbi:MAG: VWA domain-containing protein, partial [Calditrichaeota bacterium]